MNDEKKKRRYKDKPTGWSKSKEGKQIDNPNKENPSQEDDMNEKEVRVLIDKSKQKTKRCLNSQNKRNYAPAPWECTLGYTGQIFRSASLTCVER